MLGGVGVQWGGMDGRCTRAGSGGRRIRGLLSGVRTVVLSKLLVCGPDAAIIEDPGDCDKGWDETEEPGKSRWTIDSIIKREVNGQNQE